MSKIFMVSFFSGPVYQVKAENEEEAIQKAENFFYERSPHVEVHEIKEGEE